MQHLYELPELKSGDIPEFATSSHNNIKLFLYFSRFSLIFLCSYDTIYM